MENNDLSKEMKFLMLQRAKHKGEWLTIEAANEYYRRACEITNATGEDTGEFRKLCAEFQEKYGLLEMEAFNILNGYYASDYVNKYSRIKNLILLRRHNSKIKYKDDSEDLGW